MQIQNNNYNPNFRALNISKPKLWSATNLKEFVTNKEVQKFVKTMHDKGVDITAREGAFRGIHLHYGKELSIGTDFMGIDCDKIKAFTAETAVKAYQEHLKKFRLADDTLEEAMSYVDKFNKSLGAK